VLRELDITTRYLWLHKVVNITPSEKKNLVEIKSQLRTCTAEMEGQDTHWLSHPVKTSCTAGVALSAFPAQLGVPPKDISC
jgi:hypothetical protein